MRIKSCHCKSLGCKYFLATCLGRGLGDDLERRAGCINFGVRSFGDNIGEERAVKSL